jgi:hypothetical protein
VIGLGTGYTSGFLLILNAGQVTTVEINPAISGASKQFVGDLLSSSPRWSLVRTTLTAIADQVLAY